MAMDDDPLLLMRLQLAEPGLQLAHGNQRCAGNAGRGVFIRIADIEQHKRLTAIAKLFHGGDIDFQGKIRHNGLDWDC